MSQPTKASGWTELSLAFGETEKMTPRKRARRETVVAPDFFSKPNSVGFKRPANIMSLSKLIEACEPKKVSDLSVSRQKQKEIADWFIEKHCPGKPRILLLSGPSGCGKTAALKIIAKDNGYEVIEWTTPTDAIAYEGYASMKQSDKFLDFLIRATRYNSVVCTSSRRLLLVKDIPNVYLIKEDLFFTLLESYFHYGKEPLVFIFTDGGNSKMLRTLFPTNVREQFEIDHISLNSTTQAAMKNMLKRVAAILNTRASHMLDIKQCDIDEVLSNSIGDARSSILNMIFNSLKVPENKLMHDCESREESLGLFHAIGRVTNPKRIQAGDTWKFVHDPDDIASYFFSQSATFLNFLHENYTNTVAEIEDVESCADIISLSDTIAHEWQDVNLIKLNLSFCTRGIMVHNKSPVSGWNPVRKPRSENLKVSRNLATAEETWYKSIIRPQVSGDDRNADNTVIDENSD